MLVLTRKEGESSKIFNGEEEIIEIYVEKTSSGSTRIGLVADEKFKFYRNELIGKEQQESATPIHNNN